MSPRLKPIVYMAIAFVVLAAIGRLSVVAGESQVGFSPAAGFVAAMVCVHWNRRVRLLALFGGLGLVVALLFGSPPTMALLLILGAAIEVLVAGGVLRRWVDPVARPETAEWWARWAVASVGGALIGSIPFSIGAWMVAGLHPVAIMAAWVAGHAGGMMIVAPGVWAGIRWQRTGGMRHRADVRQLANAVTVVSGASIVGAVVAYLLGRPEPLALAVLALGWLAMSAGHRVTVMASSAVASVVLLAVPWWAELHTVSPSSAILVVVLGHAAASGLAIESSGRWHARALLAGVVDIATEAVLIVDADGRVMIGNPSARSLFGDALEGRSVNEFLPGVDPGWVDKRGCEHTIDGRASDGRRVPVEVTVGPVDVPGRPMMALVCRDMTEAKDAAAALRRSAEIIDASPNLVGWTDRDGSLLFLNRAGRSMIGAGDEEVVDSWTAAGLVTKEAFEEATISGSWHGETWLLLRNGIRLPVAQTVIAHTGDDGAVRFYSILATDLSERYELETMKDEFVSNVTHELRSPLTAVIGYLDLLKGGAFGAFDSEVIEVLTDVQTASNQMLELINDLLDLWRAEGRKVGDTVELTVSEVVEAAVKTMLPVAAGKRVSVSVDVAPMITVGDRRQLERALLNVVGNAIKFTPAGGDVKVKAELVGGKALIEVADTGVGIPPSEVEAVFERFYRASTAEKADIPGTGLGLPLVREVIRAHGGEAWIESTVGEGTRFLIELPTLARPAAKALAESGVSG